MSNDTHDHTASDFSPLPTGDTDDERLLAAAAALVGVPPVPLLKLFSIVLVGLAANLHETHEEARSIKPQTAAGLIRARLKVLDEGLAMSAELGAAHTAALNAERRRLAGLLAVDIMP